jgi:glycosyltransferase involved in cell wall biosynthesis
MASKMRHLIALQKFAVACPIRSVCDHHARVFQSLGRLEGHYLGTRRGVSNIPKEKQKLLPLVGLLSYAGAKIYPPGAEWIKVQSFPLFDKWVKHRIPEGTCVLSSYGYTIESFRKSRATGGLTLLDAGNSHLANYWKLVSLEHKLWGENVLPFPRKWYERGMESIELTDWVLSPSSYVTKSFINQGFPEERILHLPYPVDLQNFSTEGDTAPLDGPIRVICTGAVSLRKGFPYLLEAMRILGKDHDVELLLTDGIHTSMEKIILKYKDLKIKWGPHLSHEKLGARLKSAHVFALLSIEEGLARTALEAMACGLQVVLTSNTGAADFVKHAENGEIVPFGDPQATARAIFEAYQRRNSRGLLLDKELRNNLSFETFELNLKSHLKKIDQMGARK